MTETPPPVERETALLRAGHDTLASGCTKDNARVLRCSVRKAQELSLPAGKGPPIEHGHNGVCAVVVLLRLWMRAETVDIRVYRELKKARSAQERGTVKDAA